jgi:hypothetical protein
MTEEINRIFRVVTHKPGLVKLFKSFGGQQDLGVTVDPETAGIQLWWVPQDWAIQVRGAGIGLPQLTAPPQGWVASLDRKWLNRDVGTLLKRDIPRFFEQQGTEYRQAHQRVVVSAPGEYSELLPAVVMLSSDLVDGEWGDYTELPGDVLLQLDEMIGCVVEVRCWVAHGEITAACAYRIGMIGWDSVLFLEMMYNTQGQELTAKAVEFAHGLASEVDGPPGYAVDIGVTLDGTVTVLRAWPAWSADPLHAEPVGVFRSLAASHDFDGTQSKWTWSPDARVYRRPAPQGAEETPPIEETTPEVLEGDWDVCGSMC